MLFSPEHTTTPGGEGKGRAGQGSAGQGSAGEGSAGEGRARQGRAGQSRAGQGRGGEGRGGQGRAEGGSGTQKRPDQIVPTVSFVFSHDGPFGLVGGGGPPTVVGRTNTSLGQGTAAQGRAGHGSTGQGRARQHSTGQGKAWMSLSILNDFRKWETTLDSAQDAPGVQGPAPPSPGGAEVLEAPKAAEVFFF